PPNPSNGAAAAAVVGGAPPCATASPPPSAGGGGGIRRRGVPVEPAAGLDGPQRQPPELDEIQLRRPLRQGVTCNNGRVYKLSLTGLALGGAISPFVANCTNLQSLDLSSNELEGPIPPELYALLNLAVLNLSSNHLTGSIPPQLALCAYLNVIDFHANLLSGPIPDQLGLLARLSTFDVSYNRLSGPIPVLLANRSGPAVGLPRFNASSFVGNRDLYGYPLPPIRPRGLSVLAIIGIGLGSGLLSLVLSFTAVCIWLRVTEQAAMTPGEEGKISHLMPDY
ncbi:unnamed protein product, partial [Musa hybrid cultivar]